MKHGLIIILIFICGSTNAQHTERWRVKFTINENDAIPEGIAYDPVERSFYVSSTYKRKILKISEDGKVSDFIKEKQDGVHGILGMRVDSRQRVLWAASGDVGKGMPIKNTDSLEWGFSGLYKYDLATGKLLDKYLLHNRGESHFLNDLVLDSNGKPYITDTRAQNIYTVNSTTNALELFMNLPNGHFPNGIDITPDDKYIFITMYASPKAVYGRIETKTRKLEIIELQSNWPSGADGLYYYRGSLIAILPGAKADKIVKYQLDSNFLRAVDMKVIIENDPLFSQPTTGVIVGNRLLFIASSNLQLFARLYRENNGNVSSHDLPPIRIGEIVLD